MPVVILAGEEDFLLCRRVNELKTELVDAAWQSFNFVRQDNPSLQEVIDLSGSLPFGPGKRMVLFDHCDLFTKKRGKSRPDKEELNEKRLKTLLADFDRALSMVSSDTYLVFACPYNFDSTLRTSKIIEKYARLESFEKARFYAGSRNPQLETWCRKEAHRLGATVDDAAISYLLDSTEANLRQISSELEKSATYLLPDKHISLKTASELSPHHCHVFSLLDHWAAGRRQAALTALNELLSRGSGMPIMAALQTTTSKWLTLKAAGERINAQLPSGPGLIRRVLPTADLAKKIASQFGLKPFVVEMDLKRTARFNVLQLAGMKIRLCRLEHLVKTGQMSDVHALTLFLSH